MRGCDLRSPVKLKLDLRPYTARIVKHEPNLAVFLSLAIQEGKPLGGVEVDG